LFVGALSVAGCASGPTDGGARTSTTAAPPTTTSGSTTLETTTTSASATSNLVVTDELRSQLVAAGAAHNSLPASDYTGLRPGETYYAYDADTQTYWAAASLDPSTSSTPAQVAAQDDGAYLLFERARSGTWTVYDVGLAGTPEGSACPVTVPSAILTLWGWPADSCRPATIS
jgi:hypothetical protein